MSEHSNILNIIEEIDNQRFLFGCWETDLESVMRGNCYDDSRICEYIRNLEALVELVRTTPVVNK